MSKELKPKENYTLQMPIWAAIVVAIIGIAFVIAFTIRVLNMEVVRYELFVPMIFVCLMLAFYVYMVIKNKVEVKGEDIVVYPLIRKSYVKQFNEIKKVEQRRVKTTIHVTLHFDDGRKLSINDQMKNFKYFMLDLERYCK